MIFGKFSLNKSGVVRATVETPSTTGIVNGAAYLDDEQGDSYACVSTAAVNAADGFIGGFRYTTAGALRVSDVTAGIPASNSINQGILMTDNGQVCFSGAAGTAVINGVSVTADGAVSMQVMAFLAEFEDLGAGAVDTAVTFGNVAATFTRATTATTISRTGLVISVATGVARSYYDPTSLAYLGYLAEGARTNLELSSEDFRSAAAGNPVTNWTNTDTTVTVAGTTAPDGAATGNLLVEGSAGTAVVGSNNAALTADVISTASLFMKRGNHDWVRVQWGRASLASRVDAWFNLSSGIVGTVTAVGVALSAGATIKAYPNGWYRCTVSVNPNDGSTDSNFQTLSATADNSTTRVANGERYQWGAQIETNVAFASSYIPTTTAAVARNADVLTYPTTGWFDATVGTFTAKAMTIWSAATGASQMLLSTTTSTSGQPLFNPNNIATQIRSFDGTNTVTKLSLSNYSTTQTTFAVAFGSTEMVNTAQGLAVQAGSFDGDIGSTALGVGCTTDGLRQWFGPIRRVAYYTARLPNATLQSLTA